MKLPDRLVQQLQCKMLFRELSLHTVQERKRNTQWLRTVQIEVNETGDLQLAKFYSHSHMCEKDDGEGRSGFGE